MNTLLTWLAAFAVVVVVVAVGMGALAGEVLLADYWPVGLLALALLYYLVRRRDLRR